MLKQSSVISRQSSAKNRITRLFNSQAGVSSMVVLVLVVLLILLGWEISTYSQMFIEAGGGNTAPKLSPLTGSGCIGSNTKYDCFDQDEGTDLLD